MRRRCPARRTVPSSIQAAPSSAPMRARPAPCRSSANTEVRDATRSPLTFASASISSSVMPSLRYSVSGSGLAFTNGSTAMSRPARSTRGVASPLDSAWSAAMKSVTVGKRSAGSLPSARMIARSMRRGTAGARSRSGRWRLGDLLRHRRPRVRAAQRRLAREHLVGDAARLYVSLSTARISSPRGLLGAHVLGGAEHDARHR